MKMTMSSMLVLVNQVVCSIAVALGCLWGSICRLFKDKSNLDNSGLFDHTTDNEPIYFEQSTDTTTPFTNAMSAWGSGATGYYGGSTGFWPPTTAMPMTTTPPPPDIQNKPKPLEIPDLDAPRVINLD
jgi:hypothetical protein